MDIGNRLDVTGDVSFNSNLEISNNIIIHNDLIVDNDISFGGGINAGNDSSFNKNLYINNDLTVNNDLIVNQDGTISGRLDITGDASLNNALSVSGNVDLGNNLIVDNDISLGNRLDVGGDISLNGDVDIEGRLIINNTLTVNENTTLKKDLTVQDNLIVQDNTTLNGNVDISSLDVSNDAIFNGNVTINNTGSKFLISHGDVSFNHAEISIEDGDVKLNDSKLVIYGNDSNEDDISTNRVYVHELRATTVYADNFTSNGVVASTVNKLTVNDTSSNDGFANFNVDSTFTKNVVMNENLNVYKDLVVDGSFTVSGTTTFINTTNFDVCDNILVLNSVDTQRDSGILIKRDNSSNAFIGFDEPSQGFVLGFTDYDGSSNTTGTNQLNDISFGSDSKLTIGNLVLKYDSTKENTIETNSDGNVYVNSKNNDIITECDVFDISSNNALILPRGNINRPETSAQTGMIRYNTENSQFEGYGGASWQGLGGVINVAQNTKIVASYPNSSSTNNELIFLQQPTAQNKSDATERMRIKSNGDISMNHKLTIGDDLELAGTFIANSDRRIKDNLEKINGSIDAIETLNGYKYTRTDLKDKTKKHIGVIAQEIEEIYPELIVENKDSGIKSVNYNGLSAVLIECVKSLKQENQELKEKNKNMENKLDLLINKMDALEKKIYC